MGPTRDFGAAHDPQAAPEPGADDTPAPPLAEAPAPPPVEPDVACGEAIPTPHASDTIAGVDPESDDHESCAADTDALPAPSPTPPGEAQAEQETTPALPDTAPPDSTSELDSGTAALPANTPIAEADGGSAPPEDGF